MCTHIHTYMAFYYIQVHLVSGCIQGVGLEKCYNDVIDMLKLKAMMSLMCLEGEWPLHGVHVRSSDLVHGLYFKKPPFRLAIGLRLSTVTLVQAIARAILARSGPPQGHRLLVS